MIDHTKTRELERYVRRAGSRAAVCAHHNITPGFLSLMLSGKRPIAPGLALEIERHAFKLDPGAEPISKSVLVWGIDA